MLLYGFFRSASIPAAKKLSAADHGMPAVGQQRLETRRIFRRGYNKYISYPGIHQNGQRIIYHGFVVYGQQLLTRHPRQRIQPSTRTSRQYYSFHEYKTTLLLCAFAFEYADYRFEDDFNIEPYRTVVYIIKLEFLSFAAVVCTVATTVRRPPSYHTWFDRQ